ncbi:MAG: hypothetical protein PHU77_00440 [Simplicispira sp.]|nr:hypothetical protein [Simplicispira sp.]
MNVLLPKPVTADMLFAGTNIPVVDEAAGEVAWVSGSAAAIRDRRYYEGYAHECVKPIAAGSTESAWAPSSAQAAGQYWLKDDDAPSNRLAPFIDEYLYTKARRKGEIVYVLRVPFVTGLALYGLEGDRVEVTVTDDLGNALMPPLVRGLWEQAYGLYEYLFSDLQRVEKFTLRDIPLHPRTILTVRIVRNNADVDAAVGWISVGQWQTFYAPRSTAGGTQHGVETTPKAYNYFQRDENTGKYKRRPGRRATLISGRVLIDAKQGPRAKALLDKVQGIPVAIEASPLDRYSHISTVGFLTGSVVNDEAVNASINFKVEGNV